MDNYDVTIIGAGLAGLQCARLLGREGLRVLLVDRKNSLDQKIHTTGIFVRRTLLDFDIPDDCLGPAIKHVTLYSPALRSLEFVSEHDEFRVGRMGQLYQRYLQQCLHAGVRWLPETSYLGHDSTNSRLTVRLSTETVTTRYLIGADGARSRVARDLKLDLNQEWIVGVESVYEGAFIAGPPRLLCFLDPELAPNAPRDGFADLDPVEPSGEHDVHRDGVEPFLGKNLFGGFKQAVLGGIGHGDSSCNFQVYASALK